MLIKNILFYSIFYFLYFIFLFYKPQVRQEVLEDQARERRDGKLTAMIATDMHVVWMGWVHFPFLVLLCPTLAAHNQHTPRTHAGDPSQ